VLFNCPFCNHERSCEVKMEKTRNTGRIQCNVCMEDFQAAINFLSEPIDVYNVSSSLSVSVRVQKNVSFYRSGSTPARPPTSD
jgi:transcription elongation factor Elf1